ncbi:hypothetical protein H359_0755 [Chlamydia ibidis 10-1398/6]|nr:DUF6290 family protein [Chlamydia ibidis]EQM62555.1 hypothetical protein H359_0755 [Chlamydia ibidis 10-1398/6]
MKDRSRLTVDMSPDEHLCIKLASAKLGVTMREFILTTVFERLEELEDRWLADKATKILEDIRSGKEKTISWDEAKKNLEQ